MSIPSLSDIKRAHTRIYPYVVNTPVITSRTINELVDGEVFFKCENLQKVGAVEMRGVANYVFSTRSDLRKNGFATHSSGNHAQAVAKAAALAGVKAYIVMPQDAPPVKIAAVRGYGAELTLCEPNEAARKEACDKIVKETGAIQIHGYDDPIIIAGNATAGKELIEEEPDLDFVLCPVGGGGMAAGTTLITHYVSPSTKVILAEPENVNDAYLSFQSGERQTLPVDHKPTVADGLQISIGELNFEIIKKYADSIETVSEEEIISAMRFVWERMKMVIEPSAAVPVALLLKNKEQFTGKKTGVILVGGNVQVDNLPF
ncbi:threonine ammonia-lyase [Reichenbachiella versicolor]|uniref:threonine ammonia-lyase n=1 Tax=Reichenbachiella versicolor TaxID=1821036 RepID=UPI000D6DC849|nr:threonine/serine dehydratase [Reichenbachiella versicolor]